MSGQLYTRAGDDGFTGLLGEGRVAKYMPQPEAYGTVDEASAAMGIAQLASTQQVAEKFRAIDAARVAWLEGETDAVTALIELPKEFVVPGDTLSGAYLDLARTIVRRAERIVVRLVHDGLVENVELVRYLNRLSSLLFVLGLYEAALAGVKTITLAKAP